MTKEETETLKLALFALEHVLTPSGGTRAHVWDSDEAKLVVAAYQEINKTLAPLARKPLTKEQIHKIWEVTMFTDNGKGANLENQPFVHLARAIEKAHGIE